MTKSSSSVATVEVYGTLMKCLIRKHKPLEAIQAYHEMTHSRKITPNPQCFTLYLSALARAAQVSNSLDKRMHLQKAGDLYFALDTMNYSTKIKRVHLNSFLKVCVACADQGGWEKAFTLFNGVLASKHRTTLLDTITFSTILSLCSENRSADGYKACIDVWNSFLLIQSEEVNENVDKRDRLFNVDARLIMNILLSCIRTKEFNDALFGLTLIKDYIGLPTKNGEKFFYSEYREEIRKYSKVAIDSKSLDILLRYASRIKNPDLALLWYSISVKELGILTDDVIKDSIVQLLIEKKDFISALEIAKHGSEVGRFNKYALTIKLCHFAIQAPIPAKQFYDAFENAVDTLWPTTTTKISPETTQYIFDIIYEKQMYKSLVPLLCESNRRSEIIEGARVIFEAIIIGKKDGNKIADYLDTQEVDFSFHANKNLIHRVETLKIIQKSLVEYEKFENKGDVQGKNRSLKMLGLVAKQVDEVLDVWKLAQENAGVQNCEKIE